VLVVRGDEDYRRRRLERHHVARELHAVHAGHADVEQEHLRFAGRQALERLEAVARLAHDRVRHFGGDVLQELPHALARRGLVVNDEDAHHEVL